MAIDIMAKASTILIIRFNFLWKKITIGSNNKIMPKAKTRVVKASLYSKPRRKKIEVYTSIESKDKLSGSFFIFDSIIVVTNNK
ncbi:MAG: hypothetical protein DRP50_07320 [Thermotoga sp.]|nr:MAG: hypothetical protein DRP50_07320 [Thermotoga sp.]